MANLNKVLNLSAVRSLSHTASCLDFVKIQAYSFVFRYLDWLKLHTGKNLVNYMQKLYKTEG